MNSRVMRTGALQRGGWAHGAPRQWCGGGNSAGRGGRKADAGADARPHERRGPADIINEARRRLLCPPHLALNGSTGVGNLTP